MWSMHDLEHLVSYSNVVNFVIMNDLIFNVEPFISPEVLDFAKYNVGWWRKHYWKNSPYSLQQLCFNKQVVKLARPQKACKICFGSHLLQVF